MDDSAQFTCATCGDDFSLPADVLARYPGWTPRQCRACRSEPAGRPPSSSAARRGAAGSTRSAARSRAGGGSAGGARAREEDLTLAEVLERYTQGPDEGVFTDGAADPNPGPGGWGAVYVVDGEVVASDRGHDPDTTNNRMELTALIAGYDLVPEDTPAMVYSDSNLCVRTINEWAPKWAANGWRRKTGPIKNLDLVKELYRKARARPELRLVWIRAHAGSRWNEYADSLATAYRRERL